MQHASARPARRREVVALPPESQSLSSIMHGPTRSSSAASPPLDVEIQSLHTPLWFRRDLHICNRTDANRMRRNGAAVEGRLPRYQEEKKHLCSPAQVSVDSSGIKLGCDGNFPTLRERAHGLSFRESSRKHVLPISTGGIWKHPALDGDDGRVLTGHTDGRAQGRTVRSPEERRFTFTNLT